MKRSHLLDMELNSGDDLEKTHRLAGLGKDVKKWSPGKIILDEYKVERVLGTGGMGTVYLVTKEGPEKLLYAVKTLNAAVVNQQSATHCFIREIKTWIDLPEHPNIVTCYFFRTVEDRMAIFSEYVPCGTLDNWIQKQKIKSLETAISIAIQMAWGIGTAHQFRVIHQDIKPCNVLMSRKGTPKITDFGLAGSPKKHKAPLLPDSLISPESSVSSHGMTPAYCSPEQAYGQRIQQQTDIWSWGLCLLEMILGQRPWRFGMLANSFISSINASSCWRFDPKTRDAVSGVIGKCLEEDPKRRWQTIDEAADELEKIYFQYSGKKFELQKPHLSATERSNIRVYKKHSSRGTEWEDPAVWLKRAFVNQKSDVALFHDIRLEKNVTAQAKILNDLDVFTRILRCFNNRTRMDQKTQHSKVRLLSQKASIHQALNDIPGALDCYQQAQSALQKIMKKKKRSFYYLELAGIYLNQGVLINGLNKFKEAENYFFQALSLLETSKNEKQKSHYFRLQGKIYNNLAITYHKKGELSEALLYFDRVIAIWQNLDQPNRKNQILKNLSKILMNKSALLWQLGRYDESLMMNEHAMLNLNLLVKKPDRYEYFPLLADVCMNRGVALFSMGKTPDSFQYLDRAIDLLNKLIRSSGSMEYQVKLISVLLNRGVASWANSQHTDAIQYYDDAIEICKKLVYRSGRTELMNDLAGLYSNRSISFNALDRYQEAFQDLETAIQIRDHLVNMENRSELLSDLIRARLNRADVLISLKRIDEARQEIDAALPILKTEIERTDRGDLKQVLAWVQSDLIPKINEGNL